jgi:S-adenosylmethionine uptake transporter
LKIDTSPARTDGAATALALVSAALFAIMALLARLLVQSISGSQIALVRFATGAFVVLLMLASARIRLRPRRWGWLIARGVFGGTAVLLYFTSIEKIGVGVATLLNYTSPVWSLLFAWLFLRERPRRTAFVALVLTVAGVALLASGDGTRWRVGGWTLVATLSAVLSGMAITSIRATRRESVDGIPSEGSWTVFASFTTVGLFATVPTVVPPFGHWTYPTTAQWGLLVLCGLFSVAAQITMTHSLGKLTAAGIGILQQSTVVLAMVGGIAFFGERLSTRGAVGGALTMGGVLWSVLAERQH